MIRAYVPDGQNLREVAVSDGDLPAEAVWFDLRHPTRDEETRVERLVGTEIPTRADMSEIELSSRLYTEDGADFITLVLPHDVGEGRRAFAPVTFILVGQRLVSVRYSDPRSIELFAAKLCKPTTSANGEQSVALDGRAVFVGLIETIVDRLADLLEGVAGDLDSISRDIFRSSRERAPIATSAFKTFLRRIGESGDLISHLRESLATVDRMLPFLQLALERNSQTKSMRPRLKAIGRDVQSINDFANFLSNKTFFLLDTTVGLISVEQNGIIKIFSVAAVGFMPPTLVASIYGMNFEHMPELSWRLGYPMALGLMVLSALVPILFFRWKRWL